MTEPQRPTRAGESQICCFCYQGKQCYPKKLEQLLLMRQQIDSPLDGARIILEQFLGQAEWCQGLLSANILFFKIEQEDPSDCEYHRIWIYNASGEYIGEDSGPRRFYGRAPESLRFHHGDFVAYLARRQGFELRLGIILSLPFSPERAAEINSDDPRAAHLDETDDAYTVYSWDGEDYSHDHLPECYLFAPTGLIDQIQKNRLQDLLHMSKA